MFPDEPLISLRKELLFLDEGFLSLGILANTKRVLCFLMATIQKTSTLADILDETTNTQNHTDLPDFATYTGRWYEEQLDKCRTNRHAQLESDKSLTKP